MSFFVDENESLNLLHDILSYSDEKIGQIDVNIITNNDLYQQSFDKLNYLLSKYQEQPSLLNNFTSKMMALLTDRLLLLLQNSSNDYVNVNINRICQCIQLLCRVRGYKHVIQYFPHEVSHLELCVNLLRRQVCLTIIYTLIS